MAIFESQNRNLHLHVDETKFPFETLNNAFTKHALTISYLRGQGALNGIGMPHE